MLPNQKLLFVNKTADSKNLSKSEGAEQSRILSHVQPKSHAPPRRPGEGVLNRSEWLEGEKTGGKPAASTGEVLRTGTRRRLMLGSGNPITRAKTTRAKLAVVPPHTPSPCHPLGGTGFDPFVSTVIPIDQHMASLLNFYSSSMISQVFPTTVMVDVSRHHTLSLASQDPVLLNALLYTTSAGIYASDGDSKQKFSSIYFKGQAIHHLNQRLSNPKENSMAISVAFAVSLLLWSECIDGNASEIQTHLKGLEQLVARIDDVHGAPLPIVKSIYSFSYLCCAITQTRPSLVPILSCETEVSYRSLNALAMYPDSISGSMTHSFFKPTNAHLLGPELLHPISEQRKYIVFKELCLAGDLIPTYEDCQYFYSAQTLAEYQLLSLPFDNAEHPLTPAQESVRLALFIFARPFIALIKPSAFTRTMFRKLRASLQRSEISSLWAPNYELLLWVLFIAAHISNSQDEWTWVIVHISELVKLLRLHTVSQIEEILVGFFYPEDCLGRTLIDVWRAAQQRIQRYETFESGSGSTADC